MKKTILTLTIIAFVLGTISISYGQGPENKSINARTNFQKTQKNMTDSKQGLKETQKNFISEYRKFIKESEKKINTNKKSFAEFKLILTKINNANKAAIQTEVNGLEQKNINLKYKLVNYKTDGRQDNWTSFKHHFNNDMDELQIQMLSVN